MALTRIEIVNSIADQIGYPKNKASEMVETILEIIKKAPESGEDVMISGFGNGGQKVEIRQPGWICCWCRGGR